MIGFANFSGTGSNKAGGGIETYYKNKLKNSSNYIFFTKENTNEFDKKNFPTRFYLFFIRKKINNPFLRNHFDWYFELYSQAKKIKNSLENVEVADSFGYGIVFYLLKIPYTVKTHTPHSVVYDLNGWKKDIFYRVIKIIEKKAIQHAAKIESPSKAMIDYLISKKWKIDVSKTFVLNNAFYFGDKIENPQKEKQILFVGNLEPRKNLKFLLEAFFSDEVFDDYKLVICGSDSFIYDKKSCKNLSYWNYCNSLFPQLQNNPRVQYKGFIDNNEISKYYKSSEFFVICSTGFENFPTVVLEAFSNKTIVLGSKTGGIPEIITDSKSGFLFNDNDNLDFVKAFKRAQFSNKNEIQNEALKKLSEINKQIEIKYQKDKSF